MNPVYQLEKLFLLTLSLCLVGSFGFAAGSPKGFVIGDAMPDAPELANRGQYDVGHRQISMTDPDRLDILAYSEDNTDPRYDRTLVAQVWYPAYLSHQEKEFTIYIDPLFVDDEIVYRGRALKNAEVMEGRYPLIIISHGYPGTRFLLSYLAENLASKGYVVVAPDHTDSTVRDQAAFSSTLLNRALDQLFIIDEVASLDSDMSHFLGGHVDTDHVGIAGYSMGGFGAINAAGAGFTQAGVDLSWGVPGGKLEIRQSGNPEFEASLDSRVKAIFALAPWGAEYFWDADTMLGLTVPSFFLVGSQDDVSLYENGVKRFYDWALNSERYMLVFNEARHNIAPNAYGPEALLPEEMSADDYMRFAEPAWDERKLNNVVQHFATAFFDQYVKGEDTSEYLDLIERSNDGVWSVDENGEFTPDHTHWLGFPNRTAVGMEFYSSPAM